MIYKRPHVSRTVLRTEASDWLLLWADQGWVVSRSVEKAGTTAEGEAVVRFDLVPDSRAVRVARRPIVAPPVDVLQDHDVRAHRIATDHRRALRAQASGTGARTELQAASA